MQQHLHKFLVLYHKLDIPQVGSFTIDTEPSRFDAASGLLFAPRPVIQFHETAKTAPDKLFFNFLVEEMATDEVSAIREFHEFCYQFREDLTQKEISVLPGVGRIVRRNEGQLIFTPESTLLELLPPVAWNDAIPSAQKKQNKPVAVQDVQPEPKPQPIPTITRASGSAIPADLHAETIIQPATSIESLPEPAHEIIYEEEESEEISRTPDRWWIYAILLMVAGILAILYNYR